MNFFADVESFLPVLGLLSRYSHGQTPGLECGKDESEGAVNFAGVRDGG